MEKLPIILSDEWMSLSYSQVLVEIIALIPNLFDIISNFLALLSYVVMIDIQAIITG